VGVTGHSLNQMHNKRGIATTREWAVRDGLDLLPNEVKHRKLEAIRSHGSVTPRVTKTLMKVINK
jgi:hypothetical protein